MNWSNKYKVQNNKFLYNNKKVKDKQNNYKINCKLQKNNYLKLNNRKQK